MPFFFNNENVEVIMEDNPDDIFTPSGINHKPTSKITKIRQLISQEIKNIFETHTSKEVESGAFCNVDSFKDNMGLVYLFTFETENDEYEMIYHVPLALATILEMYSQDGIDTKKILLSLSDSIITCLNEQQDFAFLQDIELIDLCNQTVDYKKISSLKNLYSLTMTIDKKEYDLYLQLDNQFNKTF